MTTLREPMALHDIDDVEAFVNATLNSSGIAFEREERDELVAEGLAILCDLAGRFEPKREGYNQPGRFSGYAAMFLPRRLGEAWHKLHPEHCYLTMPDGSRKWVYLERELSLDGLRGAAALEGGGADSVDSRLRPPEQWTPGRRRA